MTDEIRILLESLRRGEYENPQNKIEALVAALREGAGAAPTLLVSLLRAPQIPIRLAAVEACQRRTESELKEVLCSLISDADTRVRIMLAQTLGTLSGANVNRTLVALFHDKEAEVRAAAAAASAGHVGFRDFHREGLKSDVSSLVRIASAESLAAWPEPNIVAPLFHALVNDLDYEVKAKCAELLEKRLVQSKARCEKFLPTDIASIEKAEKALAGTEPSFPQLRAFITERARVEVNPEELARYGTDLTALAVKATLPRAAEVEAACRALMDLLLRKEPRSVMLLGESGVGKTAIVQEFVHQVMKPEHGGWRVIRVTPSDFLTGTKYIGEWESRVHGLLEAARKPRRVVIYVPDAANLSNAGKHDKSDSNVAAALAPYIEDGSIVLLGETTPAEYNRGLGSVQPLQRLFEKVLVQEASLDTTRKILASICLEAGQEPPDHFLDAVLELSGYFLSNIARPGNAVTLLKSALQLQARSPRPLDLGALLNALSSSTGLPVNLLDDAAPLNQRAMREFFESRVMGQSEAIGAMLDLVTLIKAGLTDPHKPFGIFLFIGPTGVGKTELARTMAEFIFGDPKRLLRLDMSEYASSEAFERLLGVDGKPGVLTDPVRQQPFSVILLDEIEKAHINVFDLCLQLFDAGRLTDGSGRTVDFRRTIVILTSNIGAVAPVLSTVGFAPGQPPAPQPVDQERTFRELSGFFRPEFLNRLDRIVNFRPLSLEVAESIARREVEMVLARSGISRREITVDIDPSVLALLVKEGYSPHFGARPLKRAVERLVLLPLARVISGGRVQSKAVLRLVDRGGKLEVLTSPPPTPRPETPAPGPILPQRISALLAEMEEFAAQTRPLADRKSELLGRTAQKEFHHDDRAKAEVFLEIRKLEQFLSAQASLRKALLNLQHRLETAVDPKVLESEAADRVDFITTQLRQLRAVAASRNARELGDAFICLRRVDHTGGPLNAVQLQVEMYSGFAQRRRLDFEPLGERYEAGVDEVHLFISGLGAYRLLQAESGLHEFTRRVREKSPRNGKEKVRATREVVRVDVIPAAPQPDKHFTAETTARVETLGPRSRIIEKADLEISLFHQKSMRSVQLWMHGQRAEAVARLQHLLFSQVEFSKENNGEVVSGILRDYQLGSGPKVKDHRSGRSTTRLDWVLEGQIELLANETTES